MTLADIRRIANLIEPAFAIVELAQSITGLGGPRATEALRALDAAVKAFGAAADGKLTKDQVLDELARLRAALGANDADADAALTARFPGA